MKKILLLLLLAPVLYAQNANTENREHTCRTLFLNAPKKAAKACYLFDGKKSLEVKLPKMNLSPVYKFGSGDITLWLLSSPVKTLKEIPVGTPSVKVPANIMDFYLIVSSDESNKDQPLSIELINANYDRIGRGEMLWVNKTSKSIVGTIGSESIDLPANESVVIKEPRKKTGDYPVELDFLEAENPQKYPICESQWRHDPRNRNLVFIYNNGNRKAPRISSFSDFRMPENKKE